MQSQMAIEDIEAMEKSGLRLKPAEVVLLNALGLRYEFSKNAADLRIMPRVAFLGDVAFREPTIGHEIWMNQAASVFNLDKIETRIKVRAFCLATAPQDLPDLCDVQAVREDVEKFVCTRLCFHTLEQVACAIVYAESGADQMADENPVRKSRDEDGKPKRDGEICYEVGLLRNGVLLKLGTFAELKQRTVSELELLVNEAMFADDRFGKRVMDDGISDALADYWRTKDAVEKAATERKKAEDGKQD